jgi:putative transposase
LAAIVYRLRTGCQWKALPAQFGSGSTCHLRFQQWRHARVFERIFAELVRFYDARRGIQWTWTALDSAIVKAPKGGTIRDPIRRTARNPV